MINSEQEFESTFRNYYGMLLVTAKRMVNDTAAAEDLVQEVFLRLWDARSQRTVNNIKAYLHRSIVNACIDFLEKNKTMNYHHAQSKGTFVLNTTDQDLLEKELHEDIQRALDGLPPKCRAIFMLSRYEGMKYAEIAEYLELSVKTVENQMGIALEKLRSALRDHLVPDLAYYRDLTA